MTSSASFNDIDEARQHARNHRAYIKAARAVHRHFSQMRPQELAEAIGVDLWEARHSETSEGDQQ